MSQKIRFVRAYNYWHDLSRVLDLAGVSGQPLWEELAGKLQMDIRDIMQIPTLQDRSGSNTIKFFHRYVAQNDGGDLERVLACLTKMHREDAVDIIISNIKDIVGQRMDEAGSMSSRPVTSHHHSLPTPPSPQQSCPSYSGHSSPMCWSPNQISPAAIQEEPMDFSIRKAQRNHPVMHDTNLGEITDLTKSKKPVDITLQEQYQQQQILLQQRQEPRSKLVGGKLPDWNGWDYRDRAGNAQTESVDVNYDSIPSNLTLNQDSPKTSYQEQPLDFVTGLMRTEFPGDSLSSHSLPYQPSAEQNMRIRGDNANILSQNDIQFASQGIKRLNFDSIRNDKICKPKVEPGKKGAAGDIHPFLLPQSPQEQQQLFRDHIPLTTRKQPSEIEQQRSMQQLLAQREKEILIEQEKMQRHKEQEQLQRQQIQQREQLQRQQKRQSVIRFIRSLPEGNERPHQMKVEVDEGRNAISMPLTERPRIECPDKFKTWPEYRPNQKKGKKKRQGYKETLVKKEENSSISHETCVMKAPYATQERPKLLITYAMDNDRHLREVVVLYNCLKKNEFQPSLDVKDRLAFSQNIHEWTDTNFRTANFVLICISPLYKTVVESDISSSAWNSQSNAKACRYIHSLMQNEYTRENCQNKRFIPLLFPGATQDHIPLWLQNTICYKWRDHWQDILFRLLEPQRIMRSIKINEEKFRPVIRSRQT